MGIIAGILNGCVAWAIRELSRLLALLLGFDQTHLGLLYFASVSATMCGLSAFICKYCTAAAVGSGLSEVKALLASDFGPKEYSQLLGLKLLLARISGLILAQGSGLVIGGAGPLVHVTVCMAYVLMKYVPEFTELFESPESSKQIFAAAAGTGLATVFNAPVGGLLFSIEVTSTYYLIANYWKSFMAAIVGAVTYSVFYRARDFTNFIFPVTVLSFPFEHWEFGTFILLGIIFGMASHLYLRIYQTYFQTIRPYGNNQTSIISSDLCII